MTKKTFDELKSLAYDVELTDLELNQAAGIAPQEKIEELLKEHDELRDKFVMECIRYFLDEGDWYQLHQDEIDFYNQYNGVVDEEDWIIFNNALSVWTSSQNKKRGRNGIDRIYLFLLNLHLIEIFMWYLIFYYI